VETDDSALLLWIPVGAGTRFQRLTLNVYERLWAKLARRPRSTLVHAGLKLACGGQRFTVELMPAPRGRADHGEVTGPVGLRWLGRLRWFRYQVCVFERAALPDEQWVVGSPIVVASGTEAVSRLVALAKEVPAHTWGRRAPGAAEMWTSDSAISWMLVKAGLDPGACAPPSECIAPGWSAGIFEARRRGQARHIAGSLPSTTASPPE
jgi:hypothetical protein